MTKIAKICLRVVIRYLLRYILLSLNMATGLHSINSYVLNYYICGKHRDELGIH